MSTAQVGQYSNVAIERLTDLTLANAAYGGPVPGTTYWVHSRGSSSYDGKSRNQPLPTLALALAQCTAGDLVAILNGHTETLAAAGLTWSQSGVTVVGLGNARNRPAITCASADVVGITMSGNNNRIKNLRLIGAAATQTSTASVVLSLTGTDNEVGDSVFEHATTLGCVLLTAAHRSYLHDLRFIGTAAGPDFCIKTVGTAAPSNDCIIERIRAQYAISAGLDSAVIVCHNTTGIPGWDIKDVRGIALGVGILDINGSFIATQYDSLASDIYGAFSSATSTAAAFDLGATMLTDSFWSDAIAAAPMWAGVSMRIAGTAGTIGAFPAGAGPS